MLGCNEHNPPEALMWDVLNVPSLNTRPSHTFSGLGVGQKRIYNDWTKLLRNIVLARNELKEVMKVSNENVVCCHYMVNDIESRNASTCFRYGYLDKKSREAVKKRLKPELKSTKYGAVEAAWRNLMKHTAAFHSHRHKKYIQKSSYGKPLINVDERYKGQKSARLRGNVAARRVNYAGRGVLEGDQDLFPDQVGIPRREAMNLTRKIYVNKFNLREVQKWILNGPHKYPGANYVTTMEGKEIELAHCENRRDLRPSDLLFVRRHVLDDDLCLVGRQPTLHRPSMMAFRAKIIDVAPESVNIEMTGNANKVTAFLNLVEPYGIVEMARSGNLALKRG
jgi:DNA-directed RNA polymerase subunit A'